LNSLRDLISVSKIFQLYRDCQFYCWKKPEYEEKHDRPTTCDLSFITRRSSLEQIKLNFNGDRHWVRM